MEVDEGANNPPSKAPPATLAFWLAKICATTVGETGGDALSMTLALGYGVSTAIFLAVFAVTLFVQLRVHRYHPLPYWLVVAATTTVGTTTSDFFDRSLGLGYIASSAILATVVVGVLIVWRSVTGKIAVDRVTSRKDEFFYWLTILASNTLGTALGDFTADDLGLGFGGGALVFAGLIAVVGIVHLTRKAPQAILFWTAYVLTRPLGATLGDTLTKPHDHGGLALGRFGSTAVITAVMIAIILFTALRRPAQAAGPV